jgi:hypothetical protein
VFKKLWHRYLHRSDDPTATITGTIQLLVGLTAVAAGVLSVFGVDIGAGIFRGVALLVAGLVSISILVEASEREATVQRLEAERRSAEALAHTVRQVPAQDIGNKLEDLLERSTTWSFRGGSGRWLRRATLPRLARVLDRGAPVIVHLLDPRDERLCSEYAWYRANQRHPSDVRHDEDDPRTIQADILSSIYAVAWHAATSRVEGVVVLVRVFTPLRYDVGDDGLMVTVADRAAAGLWAAADTWYYRSIADELKEARRVNPTLILPTDRALFPTPAAQVDAGMVRAGLEATKVETGGQVSALLSGFASTAALDFERISSVVFLR